MALLHLITGLPLGNSIWRNLEYAEALKENLRNPHIGQVTLIEEEAPLEQLPDERVGLARRCRVIRIGRRAQFNDLIAASLDDRLNCIANADVSLNFTAGRIWNINFDNAALAVSRVDSAFDWSYDAWIFKGTPKIDARFELGRFSSDNALVYLLKKAGLRVFNTKQVLLRHHHGSGEHSAIWNDPVMGGWDTADDLESHNGNGTQKIVTIALTDTKKMAGLGDRLCGLSAAREYARRNASTRVLVSGIDPLVVQAYGDSLVTYEAKPRGTVLQAYSQMRVLNGCPTARNYLGFFHQNLGMSIDRAPRLELPILRRNYLIPEKYIAFQPYAIYARNPNPELVQSIVEMASRITGLPVVAVGRPKMGKCEPFLDVDYSFKCDSAIELMRIVGNAVAVISARSVSAHVACAYNVPVMLWSPNDRSYWHFNGCSDSRVEVVPFEEEYDQSRVEDFIREINIRAAHDTPVIGVAKDNPAPVTKFVFEDDEESRHGRLCVNEACPICASSSPKGTSNTR